MVKLDIMEVRVCPNGHEYPVDQFHSYVKLEIADLDDAITFTCPGPKNTRHHREHAFSLRKAVAGKMFSIEEAAIIRQAGIRHRDSQK